MATYPLDPNADQKADGTEVPAGSAFQRVDDAVRYPTAPDTGTDYIELTAGAQITRWDLATQALAGGETATTVRVLVYIDTTGGIGVEIALRAGSSALLAFNVPAGTPAGWQRRAVLWPLTQTQIDGLNIQVTANSGSGTCRIYAGYADLFTRTDVWATANAKVTAKRDNANGLSNAAGFMGCDVWRSVDLGGGRSLILGGDTGWATASGQQAPLGTNASTPLAPRQAFPRNSVHLLDAYNVDTANLTSYVTAGSPPTAYFPAIGSHVRWPYNGYVHNGRLYVVGAVVEPTGLTAVGAWAAYCADFSSTPDNWVWTYLPTYGIGAADVGTGDSGWHNGGDGYLYFWNARPGNVTERCVYRLPDAFTGNYRGGQWFDGTAWHRDRQGIIVPLSQAMIGKKKVRESIVTTRTGHIHLRADGKFQATGVTEAELTGGPPYNMGYRLTPGTSIANMGAQANKFLIPEAENFVYAGCAHPQLTWTGAGANDQVWSYACADTEEGDNTAGTSGFPRFVKALSIT